MKCTDCEKNGCYPSVCRCGCHPAPASREAKARRFFGVADPHEVPGHRHHKNCTCDRP